MEFNPAVLHQAIAEVVPERDCVIWRDRRISWADSAARVRRLARVLLAAGVSLIGEPASAQDWQSPHEHVGLYLYNGPEFLEAVLAAHLARAAPFNVNYRYVGAELASLLAQARPAALIYHARLAPVLAEALAHWSGQEPPPRLLLQVADDSGHALLPGAVDYEQALAAAGDGPVPTQPGPDDRHIVYTGGTTGLPKGVLWRCADVVAGPAQLLDRDGRDFADVEQVLTLARKRERYRVLPTPPFMHGSGLWIALSALVSGGTVVIQDDPEHYDPVAVAGLARRERVVMLSMVGDAMARPLVAALERGEADLTGLALYANAAAPLSADVRARLAELIPGALVGDSLGSSEGGHLGTRGRSEGFVPAAGTTVLSADRTRELAAGEAEIGWVASAGRHALGYLDEPERTRETFVRLDGRSLVISGDRGRRRDDGTIELLGRDSLVINTGGEKVFVEEVEAHLRGLPGVADAVVLGRPHERWGSEVVALVQAAAGAPAPDAEAIRAALTGQLARYKLPRAVIAVERVRRGPNGKLDYDWARQVALSGRPAGAPAVGTGR